MVLYCSAVNTNLYQPRADTNVQSHNEHHGTITALSHPMFPKSSGTVYHSWLCWFLLRRVECTGTSKSKKPAAHKNAAHGINTPRQQRRYVLLQCVLDFEPLRKINENYNAPIRSMSRRDAKVVGYQIPTFVLECLMVHYSGTASPSTAVQSQHEREQH